MSSILSALLGVLSLAWVLVVISPQMYRPLDAAASACGRSSDRRRRKAGSGRRLTRSWVVAVALRAGLAARARRSVSLSRRQSDRRRSASPVCSPIIVVLEAARRTTGWILPISAPRISGVRDCRSVAGAIGLTGIAHRGYDLPRLVGTLYMTLEGIYGVPLDVAVTYIILFSLYGAVLERIGRGHVLSQLRDVVFPPRQSRQSGGPIRDARRIPARHRLGQRRCDDRDARIGCVADHAPRRLRSRSGRRACSPHPASAHSCRHRRSAPRHSSSPSTCASRICRCSSWRRCRPSCTTCRSD